MMEPSSSSNNLQHVFACARLLSQSPTPHEPAILARLLDLAPFATNPIHFQLTEHNRILAIVLLNLANTHPTLRAQILPTYIAILENIGNNVLTWSEFCGDGQFLAAFLIGMLRIHHTIQTDSSNSVLFDSNIVDTIVKRLVVPLTKYLEDDSLDGNEKTMYVDCVLVLVQVIWAVGECSYLPWSDHLDIFVRALISALR
jgi:hypothetical protein